LAYYSFIIIIILLFLLTIFRLITYYFKRLPSKYRILNVADKRA